MPVIGMALDAALDATNLQQQAALSDDGATSARWDMAKLVTVTGAYGLKSLLGNDQFVNTNKDLFNNMRKGGTRAERAKVARDYFESGRYDAQFARSAASGRAASLSKIATAARFETKAEMSYLRNMAAVNIGRFATAANAAFFLAPALFGATYHGFKGIKKLGYELESPKMGGHFTLNNMQATERQRTISAMHNSEFNGRSAMGQEAFLYHQ